MSHIKQTLKKAREAINAQDYGAAKQHASEVLETEPSNYTACVFQGLSLLNLGLLPDAQKTYEKAVRLHPDNRLGWQGILEVYEKLVLVDDYQRAALKLADIFMRNDDKDRTLGVLQQMLKFVKAHGTTDQLVTALEVQLRDSAPFGAFLDDALPPPTELYIEMANLIEKAEQQRIDKEVNSRRSRLGARLATVKLEVNREVLSASKLPAIYENLIRVSPDEEVRREYESKLLLRLYDTLQALPANRKPEHRDRVWKLAREIVIIKSPVLLAYRIGLEWQDCQSLSELDFGMIRDFLDFFPNHGLSNCLRAYLSSDLSPFDIDELLETEDLELLDADDVFDALADALQNIPESPLPHRILAHYHLSRKDYESASETASTGLDAIRKLTDTTSCFLPKTYDAVSLILATSYVYYQAPRHHAKAEEIFDRILSADKPNLAALMGRGLIYRERGELLASHEALSKACRAALHDREAQSEYAWSLVLMGKFEEGKQALEDVLQTLPDVEDVHTNELSAKTHWRIGQCLWEAEPDKRGDRDGAYAKFVAALQKDPNLTPAFTSLGIFYADYAQDEVRASKCFQKAFELDPGEATAAERLARGFAESQDWELVEIVARRVADADKKRTTVGHELAWAQRALGVVELNARNYFQAAQQFQSALRSDPTDFHSWMGLGEAYLKTGKYIAATKAFSKSHQLDSTNWFVQYLMGSVERDIHEYENACSIFRDVLAERPEEFSVLLALAETLVTGAQHWLRQGYYARAIEYAVEVLDPLERLARTRAESHQLWKVLADSTAIFASIQSSSHDYPFDRLAKLLVWPLGLDKLERDESIDSIDHVDMRAFHDAINSVEKCLFGAILAGKKAILASADDKASHSAAWFNLGWAESKCYWTITSHYTRFQYAAAICFKRAIKLEPRNAAFWNALGCATSTIDARVSQHCFVRSLNISEKDPQTWCNIGTLYLLQNDLQLANEAFSRSQSVDPEYVMTWIGQGFVALLLGRVQDARELFEHAASISDESFMLPKLQAAMASFDRMKEAPARTVVLPLYLLDKLLIQDPGNLIAGHLRALFLERFGDFQGAFAQLSELCAKLEDRYESSEADSDLFRFACAKSDLARNSLALLKFRDAFEQANEALDLLEATEKSKEVRRSSHLVAGLAAYFFHEFEISLENFKSALEESGEDADIVDLLSKVLWAKGGVAERDVAREQLTNNIERNPQHLSSILLLGTMGILEGNDEVIEAVRAELKTFDPALQRCLDTDGDVQRLLSLLLLKQGADPKSSWQRAIFTNVSESVNWSNLATITGDVGVSKMALKVAKHRGVKAEELSSALQQSGSVADLQRSVMVGPWRKDAWRGLNLSIRIL